MFHLRRPQSSFGIYLQRPWTYIFKVIANAVPAFASQMDSDNKDNAVTAGVSYLITSNV
jgi:hypothetical protein